MSVLNQSGEEQVECPLCMEPLEVDDLHFYPCTCGYQICRFCWNRIREGENGLCPACRKAYPENPADFTPLSQEQVAAIKTEKKAREQKRRNKTLESRKALANVRVVQNNLVFVVGLPVRLADPEILKRQEYFGKYGKIHKVVINQSTTYAGTQGPSASAYVTYVSGSDALRAIQGVNNVTLDGRVLKGSLGTTKYCANFMKNQPCPKPDCMYLHELGDPKASFTKEEMHAGLHQVYERKLHMQLLQREKPPSPSNNGNAGTSNPEKSSSKEGNGSNFIPTTVVTSSNINVVNNNSNSRSKKESISSGKEAWPSLGSSPPNDAQFRKPHSPQNTVTSQETGTSSESSSPTEMDQQLQEQEIIEATQQQQADRHNNDQTYKHNDTHKKKQQDTHTQNKQKNSIIRSDSEEALPLFEARQQYLANDLDDFDSDRHSLLENHHDLLDNNLLEDDSSHNLLADHKDLMQQRHRQMLAGLTDGHVNQINQVNQIKPPMMNGFGLLERDSMFPSDRMGAQLNQGLLDKEILLRERSRSEMLMRNEMLARQQAAMENKHYMPNSSIGLDSANDLLGANYHPNHNMLPPFGMRLDSVQPSTLTNTLGVNSLQSNNINNLSANHMAPSLQNQMGASSLANHNLVNYMNGPMGSGLSNGMSPYMMQNQMLQQNQNHSQMNHAGGMVNGFEGSQNASEGRYLAENMDKFFTDFHKAQQLRGTSAPAHEERPRFPHNILSASSLEMHHKHRMGGTTGVGGARAGGDGDDDLDFDPFKETQKALAEMMESELMQKSVSSGDSMSGRLPPGFAQPRHQAARPALSHTGFNTGNSAMYTDWTQMDPAIMSTSHKVNQLNQAALGQNVGHAALGQSPQMGQSQQMGHSSHPTLTQQQHELIARFNHLGVALPINGTKMNNNTQMWGGSQSQHKLWSSGRVPLPPGFQAPAQRSAEAIDAN